MRAAMALAPPLRICPSAEELSRDVLRQVVCSVSGCGKMFSQLSALQMHLTLTHRVETGVKYGRCGSSQGDSERRVDYCCPVRKCIYSEGGSRCFKSMKLLRQHYMKVHAEKKFVCSRCKFGFGVERDYKRHTLTCGTVYSCSTCQCPYATKEALQMHCLRKRHQLPAELAESSKKARKVAYTAEGLRSDQYPVSAPLPLCSDGVPSPNCVSGRSNQILLRIIPPLLQPPAGVPASFKSEQMATPAASTSPKPLDCSTLAPLVALRKLRRIMPKVSTATVGTAGSGYSAASDAPSAAAIPIDAAGTRSSSAPLWTRECGSRHSIGRQASPVSVATASGIRQRRGRRGSSTRRSCDRSSSVLDARAASVGVTAAANQLPMPSMVYCGAQSIGSSVWTADASMATSLRALDEVAVAALPLPPVDRETQTLLDELSCLPDDDCAESDDEERSVRNFGRFLFDSRPSASTSVSSTQTDSPWWPSRLAAAASSAAAAAGSSSPAAPPLTVDAGKQRGNGCDTFVATAATADAMPLADQYAECETQTLLEELSAFTENMSTQTLHSFLFDSHSAMSFATQTPDLAMDTVDCASGVESEDNVSVGLAQCLPCDVNARTIGTETAPPSTPAPLPMGACPTTGLDRQQPSRLCLPLMQETASPQNVLPRRVERDDAVHAPAGPPEKEPLSLPMSANHVGIVAGRDNLSCSRGTTDSSSSPTLTSVDATMQSNFGDCPTDLAVYRQSGTQTVDLGDFFMISMETQTADLSVQTWTQTEDDWALF